MYMKITYLSTNRNNVSPDTDNILKPTGLKAELKRFVSKFKPINLIKS